MKIETERLVIRDFQKRDVVGLLEYLSNPRDRIFYPATATVRKKEVWVQSSEVLHPVAMHYNWAGTTHNNLFPRFGLLVTPFRTDHWQKQGTEDSD